MARQIYLLILIYLRKHQFISASECTEWKNSFENQIADYPNFPSNQNKKKFFISFIDKIILNFPINRNQKKTILNNLLFMI